MKKFITSAMLPLVAAIVPLSSYALDFEELADRLANYSDYNATAKYEVLLPTSQYPVVYDVVLISDKNCVSDSLAPATYLIEWSLAKDGNTSEGFSAYFDGNHYRYRDQRLQEFHAERDAIAFNPTGRLSDGVQNQAQFCDLLPQYIGQTFANMKVDSTYKYTFHPDTVIDGRKCVAVDGTRSFKGIEALEFVYVFDRETLEPVMSEFDSNPGQISEQIITATYGVNKDARKTAGSEDELIALYPEVFEKYRESSFRLENMTGRRLPAFSVPSVGGERYTHSKDSKFDVPTVIALLDAETGMVAEIVESLREAIDALPMRAELILAFTNNKVELIESAVGEVRQGEHLLMSARGLARDLGVTATPVILICDRSATVKDLAIGYNNDIADFVIQSTANAAR